MSFSVYATAPHHTTNPNVEQLQANTVYRTSYQLEQQQAKNCTKLLYCHSIGMIEHCCTVIPTVRQLDNMQITNS